MSMGTVIDVGLRIIRRHWAVLLVVAVLFTGPGALLGAATSLSLFEEVGSLFPGLDEGTFEAPDVVTREEMDRIIGALLPSLAATLLAGVLGTIGALGISAVVGADYHARRITVAETVRACLRGTPSALGFILVSSFIIVSIAIGALLVVVLTASAFGGGPFTRGGPGAFLALVVVVALVLAVVYLSMRWTPVLPAIAIERLGWREAMSRSWYLSGDNVWRIFFLVVVAALATALISSLLSQVLAFVVADLLATALGADPMVAESIAFAAGTVLLAPLAPVLVAVLYYDLRTRRDGTISDHLPGS